jgi:predicted nucleic acid-binding protein
MLNKVVIADTSCLIILTKIGEFDILQKVYGQLITTPEVANEFGEELPEWISIETSIDKQKQRLLEFQIDKGEASAIALALERPDSTVILDDYKARKLAEQLEITYTGTIGVVIKAKKLGIIQSIRPILDKIRPTNFRLSPELELQALKEAEE